MKTNFSLLFYMKKPKNYQNGVAPIYLRITVNGSRSEVTTGRSCEPSQWNAISGRGNGKKEEMKSFNAYLDNLQNKVFEAHRQLTEKNDLITAKQLRDQFQGKAEKQRTLIDVFKDHNHKMEALVGSEFSKGTAERYRTSLNHTVAFLQWKYNISDIDIRKVNHSFITEYDFYLRSVRKCANNSVVKYLKNFGKIIRICLSNGLLATNPFQNYKNKIKKVDRVYLNEEEINQIAIKQLASERLVQVRDVFLFCCYTGLAYVDVKNLKPGDIVTGIDGEKWISIKRQKTNVPSRIPLLPAAASLLNQYQNNRMCLNKGILLPVSSNQKMNTYLKEIANLCGIQKLITFHIARHTFATTITLLNGIPIESVSKMLGHTNIQTTQHYAKILDIKVGTDMATLKKKYTAT
ncbi:recombinase [Pedobacter sp. PACM 27299]|uniref:site-specific integrase n=1 Tax=Pedobacter sp. PACM 27299 TaxID=1727164 RepID=UPI000705E52C|nr:site-specific integrase [Pedobacter sp. PACM 27299]ALL08711.1 recombinase [Pedobacter sp. PACM 27299]